MPKGKSRSKSLLEQIAEMSDPRPKDYDIENDGMNDNAYIGSDSQSEESDEEDLKREHYISMGKSKLRQNQGIGELGPKYVGSRVSRKALYDGQDISESEISNNDDSDNSEEDSDEEDNDSTGGDSSSNELSVDGGSDVSSEQGSDRDLSDDDDDDVGHGGMYDTDSDEEDGAPESSQSHIREQIKKLEEGEKALLQNITQTARSDVEKGKRVLNQTRMWEGALDARIRVQKMVVASNELPRPELLAELEEYMTQSDEGASKQLDAARDSVHRLLDSLIKLRQTLIAQNDAVQQMRTGDKRKMQHDSASDVLESSWREMEDLRESFRGYRDSSLEKWSDRVLVTAGIGAAKKFKAVNQGIVHQIGQAMAAKERLIERTHLKRTEYKIIGEPSVESEESEKNSKGVVDAHLRNLDTEIFDDSDFYQQLLRELIESRMVDSNDPSASTGMRWAVSKQQGGSKKRTVDRKASKIRYDVMEKLQNFMPPVPAGTWHEDMINELFSSLLGQRVPQSILDVEDEPLTPTTKQTEEISASIGGSAQKKDLVYIKYLNRESRMHRPALGTKGRLNGVCFEGVFANGKQNMLSNELQSDRATIPSSARFASKVQQAQVQWPHPYIKAPNAMQPILPDGDLGKRQPSKPVVHIVKRTASSSSNGKSDKRPRHIGQSLITNSEPVLTAVDDRSYAKIPRTKWATRPALLERIVCANAPWSILCFVTNVGAIVRSGPLNQTKVAASEFAACLIWADGSICAVGSSILQEIPNLSQETESIRPSAAMTRPPSALSLAVWTDHLGHNLISADHQPF
ncbi:rRNA-processing protein bfr2 [Coemansia sp. Benny D115]|nr:rRNA-processing protein bfr2 [Coemansia sp. Benny D115]